MKYDICHIPYRLNVLIFLYLNRGNEGLITILVPSFLVIALLFLLRLSYQFIFSQISVHELRITYSSLNSCLSNLSIPRKLIHLFSD
jgi:hypothetical protein